MLTYLCAFLGCCVATLVWTPIVIRIGNHFRVLDHPGLRRIHKSPVPRLGGLAIAVPILAFAVIVCLLDNQIGERFQAVSVEMVAILGGSLAMFLVGLTDDLRGMRARHKLVAQLIAATTMCALGVRLDGLRIDGVGAISFGLAAWPLTIIWIVGITNAVNLIDGLDGLAAGIAAITIGTVGVIALNLGQPVMATLMLICLGSLIGFLVFNFNPARIFLGDSGTYFLGFLLATSSLTTSVKTGAVVGLTLPLLALGIPLFDTLFAMLRRALDGRPLFAPDRGHIHHRLIDLGLHQRRAVVLLYLATSFIVGFGMFMLLTRGPATLIIFGCLVVLLVGMFRFFGAVRLRETLAGIQKRRGALREIGEEKEVFQESDLRLREAASFDEWWDGLCGAASELGFAALTVVASGDSGVDERTWSVDSDRAVAGPRSALVIPVDAARWGVTLEVRASVPVGESIESAGRRMAVFGRLLERSSRAFDAWPEDASRSSMGGSALSGSTGGA